MTIITDPTTRKEKILGYAIATPIIITLSPFLLTAFLISLITSPRRTIEIVKDKLHPL